MSDFKAVIYDCDGVMFDSFRANLAFYQMVMSAMGRKRVDEADSEKMLVLHTFANRKVLEYFFPDKAEYEQAVEIASTIDYSELVPLMIMEDGFIEVLKSLKGKYEIAVCTNRSSSMETVLDSFGIRGYFSHIVTANRVTNPKPHPEPLFNILDHYGINPSEALFVGDSEVDYLAARDAKVPFAAYKNDFPSLRRIDHHIELLDIL